ncbi:MAG: hypothetical protein GEU73_12995 [Chloroflexi bacterium]|nr:hypothetical protein [Chloroflexota bacterium]
MNSSESSASAELQLAQFFHRNGYVRRLKIERRRAERSNYKKGDEVRLVAWSESELTTIRRLLNQAGFTMGRPFSKDNQFRQPVYGRQQVAKFLAMVAAQPALPADGPRAARRH